MILILSLVDSSISICKTLSVDHAYLQFNNNYATLAGHANIATAVVFSPDNSVLASKSWDGTVRLWNVSDGTVIHVLRQQANTFYVPALAFSPDGTLIASGGWYGLRTSNDSIDETCNTFVKLWDVASGSLLHTLIGYDEGIWALSFSPDGRTLAVGGGKGDKSLIRLWNTTSWTESSNFTDNTAYVTDVAFSPDGTMLASDGDHTVKLWNVTSGSVLRNMTGHSGNIQSIAFSPDGTMLASGSADNTVKLWDVSSGSIIQDMTGQGNRIYSVAFSPDGTLLASAGGYQNADPGSNPIHNATIELWDVSNGERLNTLIGHKNVVSSVAFSPDGTKLASASWDWTVKLWGDCDPISAHTPDDWLTSNPDEQGMSSIELYDLLDRISEYQEYFDVAHGLVVVRHGFIVAEGYFGTKYHQYTQYDKHQLHSVTKSVISALVGMAIDNGFIASVNQKVLEFFPEKEFLNVDPRKEAMTIEHLLTMTTGLDWPEWETGYENPNDLADVMLLQEDSVQFILDKPMEAEPGTVFSYNSGASHLLSHIIQRATGCSTLEFAQKYLFDPLNMRPADWVWDTDYQGIARGHSNLFLTPRSMAKIGQLFLNNGTWNGRQVISEEWVVNSTRSFVNEDGQSPDNDYQYGYQWWIDEGDEIHENVWGGHFAGYHAMGLDGHYIFVLPEFDIVVALTECLSGPSMIDYDIIPAVVTYEVNVESSPINAVFVVINGVPYATPYADMLPEGSYTLEMPQTHQEYKWSHWLEDGATNRTRTIALNASVTLTGVFFPMADFNCDGKIDGEDVIQVAWAFGSYPGHSRWNLNADINDDKIVDGADLIKVARNFGN